MTSADKVFELVDDQRADEFAALFADGGRFVFGNNEALAGREAIAAGNRAFFAMIQSLSHEIVNAWVNGSTTVAETTVTYTRLDGRTVTVPAVSIWEVDEAGLITSYRIFVDLAPLFAP
ncbi:nuclear transport factor 2 family protein [Kribbella sp. NPDC056861]|uniref:nuclear transport factor 2 family protein n=1 Tax=Kribbella sp. NPDC056861 TaxID=3154857 RepID=UPI00341B3DA9